MREAGVKWRFVLDIRDLFGAKCNLERFEIALELLDLPSTDNREDVGCLLHHVRNRD